MFRQKPLKGSRQKKYFSLLYYPSLTVDTILANIWKYFYPAICICFFFFCLVNISIEWNFQILEMKWKLCPWCSQTVLCQIIPQMLFEFFLTKLMIMLYKTFAKMFPNSSKGYKSQKFIDTASQLQETPRREVFVWPIILK